MDPARPSASSGPPSADSYAEVQASAEFAELRRAYRSFAFPLTVAFIAWYLLYVLLSNYAGGFMGTKVVGNINVALVFGLAQFAHHLPHRLVVLPARRRQARPHASAIKAHLEGPGSWRADA